MKTVLVLGILFFVSNAQAADATGENILYEFKDGKASLLLKGEVAERLYALSNATPQRIDDVDAPCWLKSGRDYSCYSRRDKNETQCVISLANTATGQITK